METDDNKAAVLLTRRQFILSLAIIGISPRILASNWQGDCSKPIATEDLLLMVTGILQPVDAIGVHAFLTAIAETARRQGSVINLETLGLDAASIASVIGGFKNRNRPLVIEVGQSANSSDSNLYSLTQAGNDALTPSSRGLRDVVRLFLLRGPRQLLGNVAKLGDWRGRCDSTGGVSPSFPTQYIIDSTTPKEPGWLRSQVPSVYFVEDPASALHLPRHFRASYLSFASPDQIVSAGDPDPEKNLKSIDDDGNITGVGIALCIGISWQMLFWIARTLDLKKNPSTTGRQAQDSVRDYSSRHYNRFYLGKGDTDSLIGPREPAKNPTPKKRLIESPRIFLKVIQRFILDFLLANKNEPPNARQHPKSRFPHPAVHSYVQSRSSLTNAQQHLGKRWLAKLDIEDFFGSINRRQVQKLLVRHGYASKTATLLARLCTILDPSIKDSKGFSKSRLPQGAPTSPYLSNLLLYELDEKLSEICSRENMRSTTYTRYADDIAISGDSFHQVNTAFLITRKLLLKKYRLQVNNRKCCFISRSRHQRVTGVVVNEKAQPPRTYRKRVRAAFHRASLDPQDYVDRLAPLQGHLNYLRSFHDFPRATITKYEGIIERVKRVS